MDYKPTTLLLPIYLLVALPSHAAEGSVETEVNYTGEYASELNHGASTALGKLDASLSFDTEAAGLWRGGIWFAEGIIDHGGSPSAFVGDVQAVSNIEDGSRVRLQQFWYEHSFNNAASFLLGWHDLNAEFYVSDYAALFLNSSFGIGPEVSGNVPTSLFPEAGLAARLRVQQGEMTYAVAVYDGDPATRRLAAKTEGLMFIAEAAWQQGDTAYKAGIWQHSADKLAPEGKVFSSDAGVYAIINQPLDDTRGFFVQLGLAQSDRNDIANYLGLGFVNHGGVFGRIDDSIGLALARAGFSPSYQNINHTTSAETAYELTYSLTVNEHVTIHPALQYVTNPSGDASLANVWLGQLRIVASL